MPAIGNSTQSAILRSVEEQAEALREAQRQIASGKRAENAGDDPAGVALSLQLNADVVQLNQLSLNVAQGSTVLQTADGGLAQIGNALTRLQTLAAQAQNGAIGAAGRDALNTEFQALVNEVNNIAGSTEFNGQQLLDGSYNQDFLVGLDPNAPGAIQTVTIGSTDINTLTGGAGAGDLLSQANANAAFNAIDTALNNLSGARAQIGAGLSSFEARGDVLATSTEAAQASYSAQSDADIAAAFSQQSAAEALSLSSIIALKEKNEQSESLKKLLYG